jgi:hypothetical protein
MAFLAAALAYFSFGFLVGRWWSLALPVASTTLFFAGVGLGLWRGGFAEGWQVVFAVVVFQLASATALGVGARKGAGRLGLATGWPLTAGPRGAAVVGVAAILTAVVPPVIDGLASRPDTDFEVADVKQMRGAPLYYLGDSFDGLPLTAIIGDPSRNLSFIYGDCEIPIGIDPGGCGPPLEVLNEVCRDRTIVVLFGSDPAKTARAGDAVQPVNDLRAPRPLIVGGVNPGCGGG